MQLQDLSFFVWLGLTVIIALVFTFVAIRARHSIATNLSVVNRFRFILLAAMLVFSVILLGYTLPKVPYPAGTEQPDKVVFVAAKQFAFAISDHPVTTEEEWEEIEKFGELVEVPLNKLVEFRVSSIDVNHGFAVYNPQGTLLGQVQAMPGYTSRVRFLFEEPGKYEALCLEFCGHSHHSMSGSFIVK